MTLLLGFIIKPTEAEPNTASCSKKSMFCNCAKTVEVICARARSLVNMQTYSKKRIKIGTLLNVFSTILTAFSEGQRFRRDIFIN